MNVWSIFANITANSDEFDVAMEHAESTAQRTGRNIEASIQEGAGGAERALERTAGAAERTGEALDKALTAGAEAAAASAVSALDVIERRMAVLADEAEAERVRGEQQAAEMAAASQQALEAARAASEAERDAKYAHFEEVVAAERAFQRELQQLSEANAAREEEAERLGYERRALLREEAAEAKAREEAEAEERYQEHLRRMGEADREHAASLEELAGQAAGLREEADAAMEASAEVAEETSKKVGSALQEFGGKLTLVGAAVTAFATGPVVLAFAKLRQMGDAFGQYAIGLQQMSAQSGLTTDSIQTLGYVAAGAGTNVGTLTTASSWLSRNLANAGEEGNDATEALARLGVAAVDDATGGLRSIDDILAEVLPALADVEDTTDRSGLAWALFGRAARTMTPILALSGDEIRRMSDEAAELGVVLDEDVIREAVRTQGEMAQMRLVMQSAWQEVSIAFLPVMRGMAEFMRDTVVPVTRSVAERVTGMVDAFVNAEGAAKAFGAVIIGTGPVMTGLGVLLMMVDKVIAAWGRLRLAMVAFFTGPAAPITLAVVGVTALILKMVDLDRAMVGDRDSVLGAVRQLAEAFGEGDQDGLIAALDAVIENVDESLRPALTRLREDLIQTGDVGVEQALRIAAAFAGARLEQSQGMFGVEKLDLLWGALDEASDRQAAAAGWFDWHKGGPAPTEPRRDFRAEASAHLDEGNFVYAIGVLNEALETLGGTTGRVTATGRWIQQYIDYLNELQTETFTAFDIGYETEAASRADTTKPPPGEPPPGGTPPRTEKMVWDELAAFGLQSMEIRDKEIRAGMDAAEAELADLERRRGALADAKTELLRDFYDDLSDAELTYLNDRLRWVDEQVAARLASAIPAPGATWEESVAWAQQNPDAFNLERPSLTGDVIPGWSRAPVPVPGVTEPAWGTSEQGIANVPVDEQFVLWHKSGNATRVLADRAIRMQEAAAAAAEASAAYQDAIQRLRDVDDMWARRAAYDIEGAVETALEAERHTEWVLEYVEARQEADRLLAESEVLTTASADAWVELNAALEEHVRIQAIVDRAEREGDRQRRVEAYREQADEVERLTAEQRQLEFQYLMTTEGQVDATAGALEYQRALAALGDETADVEGALEVWLAAMETHLATLDPTSDAWVRLAFAIARAREELEGYNEAITAPARPEPGSAAWALFGGHPESAITGDAGAPVEEGSTRFNRWSEVLRAEGGWGVPAAGAVGFAENMLGAVPVFGEAMNALAFDKDDETGDVSVTFDWMQMLTELIMRLVSASEPFAEFLEDVVDALAPFAARLGEVAIRILEPLLEVALLLLDALWPVIESMMALLDIALQPLVWILETVVVPVLDLLARVVMGVANVFIWFANLFRREKIAYLEPGSPRDDPRYNPPPEPEPPEAPPQDEWVEVPSQSFGGTPQAVQLAVATPLVEASWVMMDAALMMQETFASLMPTESEMGFAVLPPFTSAIERMTPVLERLLSEGISITAASGSVSGSSAQTAYLRGI